MGRRKQQGKRSIAPEPKPKDSTQEEDGNELPIATAVSNDENDQFDPATAKQGVSPDSRGENPKDTSKDASAATPRKQRFVVFVGNLPFTATVASIQAHFSKVSPAAVRLMSDKATSKSRGFAFLDFEDEDAMQRCLTGYHRSAFPGAPGEPVRRINVELTAGGGGSKSQVRKAKIKEKNERLREERLKLKGETAEDEDRHGENGVREEKSRSKPKRKAEDNANPAGHDSSKKRKLRGKDLQKNKARKQQNRHTAAHDYLIGNVADEETAAAKRSVNGRTATGQRGMHPDRLARIRS